MFHVVASKKTCKNPDHGRYSVLNKYMFEISLRINHNESMESHLKASESERTVY